MANRTRYPRDPEKYPDEDKYPEIMSKMDPLIIRVSPTVLLVGSTTYTAKIKLGYRFNGFNVNVTGVGIPIYTEEVNIRNASTTNKSAKNGMSDAYNKVEEQATRWMDDLEKSMLDDSKEKNIVDLLREIKYQMHFDASGHKYPAIIKPNEPGYKEEDYDPRMEVCTDVPTYIEDLYTLLLQMSIKLDNLTTVINSGRLKKLNENSVVYDQQENKFKYTISEVGEAVVGLNDNISNLCNRVGSGEGDSASLQARITKIQESIGNISSGHTPDAKSVIGKLETIQKGINDSSAGAISITNKLDTVAGNLRNVQAGESTISGAVNQLVAQMNTMNAHIGTPSDPAETATLFGNIVAVKTDTNNILTKPILGMDSAHVDYLEYWGQDLYKGYNDGTSFEYLIGAMKTFFTKNGTCTAKKLDSALCYGTVLYDYDTSSGDRGYRSSTAYDQWGVLCHHWPNPQS